MPDDRALWRRTAKRWFISFCVVSACCVGGGLVAWSGYRAADLTYEGALRAVNEGVNEPAAIEIVSQRMQSAIAAFREKAKEDTRAGLAARLALQHIEEALK